MIGIVEIMVIVIVTVIDRVTVIDIVIITGRGTGTIFVSTSTS